MCHLPSTKASTALSTSNFTVPIFLLYVKHSCVVDSKTKAKHESSPPQFTAHSAMLRAFSEFAASPQRYPGCFSNCCIFVDNPGQMRSTTIVAITFTVPTLIFATTGKVLPTQFCISAVLITAFIFRKYQSFRWHCVYRARPIENIFFNSCCNWGSVYINNSLYGIDIGLVCWNHPRLLLRYYTQLVSQWSISLRKLKHT